MSISCRARCSPSPCVLGVSSCKDFREHTLWINCVIHNCMLSHEQSRSKPETPGGIAGLYLARCITELEVSVKPGLSGR